MSRKNTRLVTSTLSNIDVLASPVLKWAGGKSQLLPVINSNYPSELLAGAIDTYIEPFVGGGAVFFDVYNKYHFKKAFLFDSNPELVILYNTLKLDVDSLLLELKKISEEYLDTPSNKRENFFYMVRTEYNSQCCLSQEIAVSETANPTRSAKTIFLNRTCFNGLFRVNSKGAFNVPYGKYSNPNIVFENKLLAASEALQNAFIKLADFSLCENYISGKTFIYYDPPYRPLSKTSQFTAYSKSGFNDKDQIRLANLYKKLNARNVKQLLSNSDPSNYEEDSFFDDLYSEFQILRTDAKRMINSNAKKRGKLREILVKNY